MPIFQYRAFGADGETHKGSYDATTESDVRQYLRSNNLYPVEIKLSRFSSSPRSRVSDGKSSFSRLRQWVPYQRNYSRQLTILTRQLETLLGATIPYDKALEMVIAQTADASFKSILSDIRSKVVEGEHLAEAMGTYPNVFSPMYISMVRSGENSGKLDMIMQRLADYYETQEKLQSKLKSAMIYPIFMLIFSIGVVAFMMTSVVPKITAIFADRGGALPVPTQILITVSDFFTEYWAIALGVTIMTISSVAYYMRTASGKRFWDRMEITLPLLKTLTTKVLVLRFCQTLGTLLNSGVDLKSALEISKHVVVNHIFIKKLNQLIVDVNNKGIPLSSAMQRAGFFPEYVCHVVAIGEQAAKVDELLEKVSDRMQMEVSDTINGLTTLLQPIMVVVMGGVVGFIALAILLPMLNMNQLLR